MSGKMLTCTWAPTVFAGPQVVGRNDAGDAHDFPDGRALHRAGADALDGGAEDRPADREAGVALDAGALPQPVVHRRVVGTTAEYHGRIGAARAFLEGRGTGPVRLLAERIQDASARLDFEYAARLNERRQRLEKLRDYLASFRGQVENLSFVYTVPGYRGNDRLYLIHRGRIRGDLPLPKSDPERDRVRAEVESVYRSARGGDPAELDADAAAEVLLVATWFKRKPRERKRAVEWSKWLGAPTRASGRYDRTGG